MNTSDVILITEIKKTFISASLAYAGTKLDRAGAGSGGLSLPGGASLGPSVGSPSLLGPSSAGPQLGGGSLSFGGVGAAPSLSGTTNFGSFPGLSGQSGAVFPGNAGLSFVSGRPSGAPSSLGRPAGAGAGSVGAAPGLTGSASSPSGAGLGQHGAGGSFGQPGYFVSWGGAPSYGPQVYGQAPYVYGYGNGPSLWAVPAYGGYGYGSAGYGSGYGVGYGQGYGGYGPEFIPGAGGFGYYQYPGGFAGASPFGAGSSQVSLASSSGRSSGARSASGSSARSSASRQ